MKNRIWINIAALSVLLLVIGHWVAGRWGLLVAFWVVIAMDALIFFYPSLRLLRLFKVRELEGQDPWGIRPLAARLAAEAKIPTPRLFIADLQTPTAYSAGVREGQCAVVISEGFLNSLSLQDVETVLAIEMVKIRRLDTLAGTVGAALGSLLSVKPLVWFSAPLLGLLLRVPGRRNDTFEADKEAAALLGSADRVAQLLWRLRGLNRTQPLVIGPAYAHLFTVRPLTAPRHHSYFSLQPTAEDRIRKLIGHFPI